MKAADQFLHRQMRSVRAWYCLSTAAQKWCLHATTHLLLDHELVCCKVCLLVIEMPNLADEPRLDSQSHRFDIFNRAIFIAQCCARGLPVRSNGWTVLRVAHGTQIAMPHILKLSILQRP